MNEEHGPTINDEFDALELNLPPLHRLKNLVFDIRNPISLVDGYAEVMLIELESFRHKLDAEEASQLEHYIHGVQRVTAQMHAMIDEATQYARLKAQATEAQDHQQG
jgi:signal transduction histidine kinase